MAVLKYPTRSSCSTIYPSSQEPGETLLSDTCLVIFVIIFCAIFTVLLATWHKDTIHRCSDLDYQHQVKLNEAGLRNYHCLSCPKITPFEKFCNSDFSLLVRITSNATNLSPIVRTYSFESIKLFRRMRMKVKKPNNKTDKEGTSFPFVKPIDSKPFRFLVLNSTYKCNLDFNEGSDYVVSGKMVQVKGEMIAVVTPCDLIIKWNVLSLQEHFVYRSLLQSGLCYR